MAVHAVGGPGESFQPLRRDGVPAGLAVAECACLDPAQRAFYLDEMDLFASAELLAALALRYLRGRGRLGAVGNPWMLDFLGELQPDPGALSSV